MASELDDRPKAGRVVGANDRAPFLVVVGGRAKGEKLKAEVVAAADRTAAHAAEWNLILYYYFVLIIARFIMSLA